MKQRIVFLWLALTLLTLFSLRMGAIPLPWRALLSGWHADSEYHYVLMQYRLPRVVLALIIGAALAVSGRWFRVLCIIRWPRRTFWALTTGRG